MNKVILTGRLTKDVDLRTVQSTGNSVAKFTIAVNRDFKKDETDFINCTAFGKTAETIERFFTKGRPIMITGRIQVSSYDKDGQKRYSTDVIVDNFEFMLKDNTEQGQQSSTSYDDLGEGIDLDEDVPF